MRSQIPRPDQRFGKIIKVSGQDVILADEVWYRYLTAEHSDVVVIETESALALSITPNVSQVTRTAKDAQVLAMTQPSAASKVDDLLKRVKALEALVYGR